MGENQIQPQPYWADFKIKVGLYAKQEENGETKRVLIFPKDQSLFNRLPDFTNSNSRTINIVDNPGTSELMGEDMKIATDKNWVVITK